MYTTGSSVTTDYFHADHLGSISVVSNSTGTVITRYTYDAWGVRVAQTGSLTETHHGFTAHEHLDNVGLIHMNGRVYDPVLARFMSADPYVQTQDNMQSYNRYSYVWNNPLSGADPSGYWNFWKSVKAIFRYSLVPSFKNTFNLIQNQPGQQYIDQFMMRNPALVQAAQVITSFIPGVGIFISAGISAYYTGLQGGSEWDMAKSFGVSLGMSYVTQQVQSGVTAGQDLKVYQVNMVEGAWVPTAVDSLPSVGDIFVGMNGMENTLSQAVENIGRAAKAAKIDSFYLIYNPSQSFIADLAQSGQDVLFSGSAASRQLGELLRGPLENGATITLVGHSQGAAMVLNSAKYLQELGVSTSRLTISAFGAPVSESTFRGLGINVGYFKVTPYDAVTNIVGRNAKSAGSFFGSLAHVPYLFTNTASPHGAYNYFP